jgi:hypothetical protein
MARINYQSMSNGRINGVSPQQLGSLLSTLKDHPDASEARFFVKTEWKCQDEHDSGGFCVRSSCKDFQLGAKQSKEMLAILWSLIFLQSFQEKVKVPPYARDACLV